MKNPPDLDRNKTITRRSFTVGAAAAATAALIPSTALAHSSTHASAHQQTSAMEKLSPQSRAEVEMKINGIFLKYGSRLNDEQKADIRRIMTEGQEGLEKMRAFALQNSDQPATVFKTYRERQGS
ncbi:MAG TPA: hypothetical protein VNW97_13055 [Candidatus Saccharimonadales bacterium]|jgi:hypothetical protein|nr:hypothetical protein [Candidatus Saccharimonadales bacterium]